VISHRFFSLTTGVIIASGLTLATLASATADEARGPAYSVQDVVAHFAPKTDLGQARRLCIGTPSECGAPEPAVNKAPFNLKVQFEFNSARLTPEAEAQLAVFAEAATGDLADQVFAIDGHTDATGAESTNQVLSERRAASVVDYLVARGVSEDRLVASGYGESQPVSADPYDEANRRVEATLAEGR